MEVLSIDFLLHCFAYGGVWANAQRAGGEPWAVLVSELVSLIS